MKKKLLFIYNPCAGKGIIRNKLSYIIETFINAEYEVTIYATRKKNDATQIVREQANEYDLIACSGGDGTLNEVTIGLIQAKKRPPCGYIPAGTTNDMATSLHIPKNMIKAAEVVVNGVPFPYDLGSINEDYFIYIAAFGAFTDVSYATSQSVKNVLGRLAYFLEGVKRIPSLKSYHYKVSFDDQVIEDDFIFGMVSNSNSVGGFRGLGRDVSLNDGLFEVTLVRTPHNPMDLQMIINALLTQDKKSKFVYSFHTSEIHLLSDEMVPWTVDGEFGGNFKEATVVNHPHAISYMVAEKE